jgi:FPC/CPF motif-containing protein YcgG
MRYLLLLLSTALFVACSNDTPEDLEKQVEQFISEDNYTDALSLLNDADPANTEADIPELKEKAHLNYGLYLEYRGPEDSSMRDRMTSALEQYIEVLNINPQNEKARAEIKQIMGIYDTMPDKSPGEEILSDLRELGFDY